MGITISDLDGIVQKANALAKELRMKLRHPNCQNTDCPICFRDHHELEKVLQEKTEKGKQYDLLGIYHKWLTDNDIPAETEWGWASTQAFEDANIDRFCEWFKKEH